MSILEEVEISGASDASFADDSIAGDSGAAGIGGSGTGELDATGGLASQPMSRTANASAAKVGSRGRHSSPPGLLGIIVPP
jgi:hypothetical protein